MSDLEQLRMYVAEYREKGRYRFSSGNAAIEVSRLESVIRGIVGRHPADRDIVLEGVSVDGFLLEYVSDELKKDPAIVAAALKNNPNAAQFVSDKEVLKQVKEEIALEEASKKSR